MRLKTKWGYLRADRVLLIAFLIILLVWVINWIKVEIEYSIDKYEFITETKTGISTECGNFGRVEGCVVGNLIIPVKQYTKLD